jgi:hypothetical protein
MSSSSTHAASSSSSSSKAGTSKQQEQPAQQYPEIFAAWAVAQNYTDTKDDEVVEQFNKTCHVVKASTGRLPFSDPTDPGTFVEREEFLELLNGVKGQKCNKRIKQAKLSLDDPRLHG